MCHLNRLFKPKAASQSLAFALQISVEFLSFVKNKDHEKRYTNGLFNSKRDPSETRKVQAPRNGKLVRACWSQLVRSDLFGQVEQFQSLFPSDRDQLVERIKPGTTGERRPRNRSAATPGLPTPAEPASCRENQEILETSLIFFRQIRTTFFIQTNLKSRQSTSFSETISAHAGARNHIVLSVHNHQICPEPST